MPVELSSETPLISCVMPTYGRPQYVNESIAQFLAQDYPNKELVIVNDCPGQVFHGDLPGVKIINREGRFPSLGVKRNFCIEQAAGELIAVWDDDDVFLPWRLSFTLGELQRFGTPFYRAKEFLAYWGEDWLHDNQAIPSWLSHPNTLFTKQLWDTVGRYPDQNVGEDAEFFLKIHRHLDEEHIVYPIAAADRFMILRGKSNYSHMSMTGGINPLDTTPGAYHLKPIAIADLLLQSHVRQRLAARFNNQLSHNEECENTSKGQSTRPSHREGREHTSGENSPTQYPALIIGYEHSVATNAPPVISVCVSIKNRSRIPGEHDELQHFPKVVQSLALAAQTIQQPVELLIADFCSDDWPPSEWLSEYTGQLSWQLVTIAESFSRGRGLNAITSFARSEYLFFCDADILVDAVALQRAIDVTHDQKIWSPICQYLNPQGDVEFWQDLGTGLVAASRSQILRAGGVPEFRSWGGEDDILMRRLYEVAPVIRERFEGLHHQWHPDYLRDAQYEKGRGSDFHEFSNLCADEKVIAFDGRRFHCTHPSWTGKILLFSGGQLARPGIDNGQWELFDEVRLVLKWDRWPAEVLDWDRATQTYRNDQIGMTAREVTVEK